MRYRKLDSRGDYTIGRRDEFYEGAAAVAQAVKTRLLLLLGEWWECPESGTPLFEEVLGKRFRTDEPPDAVDLVFSERINGTQGVADIVEYDSKIDPETRTYTASIKIRTIYDEEFQIEITSGGGNNLLEITL